jgi:signal transduction protein with GAF and PtsI domain
MLSALIVASSGIVGRHLYAKIHYGMYGQRATIESLRADVDEDSRASTRMLSVVALVNDRLRPYEQRVLEHSSRVLPSVLAALLTPLTVVRLRRRLGRAVRGEIDARAAESAVVAEHRERLLQGATDYLQRRLGTYRKFAQVSGCERLFGLWHVVHLPLFLVMVLAAIVHVIAVHAY